jgi:hypothetical protein
MRNVGRELAITAVHIARTAAGELSRTLGVTQDAIFTEYLILWTWLAKVALSERLNAPTIAIMADMDQSLFDEIERTGHDRAELTRLFQSRHANYDKAMGTSKEPGQTPFAHVSRYFSACCHAPGKPLAAEGILPDPDELAQLPGANPEFIRQLREAIRLHPEAGIYSLNALVRLTVEANILASLGSLRKVLSDMLG